MGTSSRIKNGLWKRGGSWYVAVKVDGKLKTKSFGADKEAAEIALFDIKKRRTLARVTHDWSGLHELFSTREVPLFEEVAANYFAERQHLKKSTRRSYEEILKNHLLPEFGKLSVDAITEECIARFQTKVAARVSGVRTNNILGLLRYILKVCARRKQISDNPAVGVKRVREEDPDVDPLTAEELEAVMAALPDFYRPLFTVLAWTGARPNELFALRWKDVDFQRREIHIKRGRVRGVEDTLKTRASKRTIMMLTNVEQVLLALKERRIDPDGYVFLSKRGEPINKHWDRPWRDALKKAGVKHRASYQLRHTFASLCIQGGADPGWVAKTLGHANLQTTFRHYARYIQSASRGVNEQRLEELVNQRRVDKKVDNSMQPKTEGS